STALNIETEMDHARFDDLAAGILHVRRRPNRCDAERHEQQRNRGGENFFPQAAVGREIPTKQDEQAEAGEKCQGGTHSFKTFVIADFSISIFTLSATFTITVVSFTFAINPWMPAFVTTRSPVFKLEIRRCCSCCRFFCGRNMTKYMMTKMKMNGTKNPMPPAGPGAGAAGCA